MCRWMGSYFHDWIDYNGVAFSIEFLEWGRTCNCAVLSCGPTFTNNYAKEHASKHGYYLKSCLHFFKIFQACICCS